MCSIRYPSPRLSKGDHELDDVLEKQADIIRFMKQHNDSLSKRIRHLTDELGEYERGIQ